MSDDLPLALRTREEGSLVVAELVPTPAAVLREQLANRPVPEPITLGSVSRAVCDATGGTDGEVFKHWLRLMNACISVACLACWGFEVELGEEISEERKIQ